MRSALKSAIGLLAFGFCACSRYALDTEWSSEEYRLIWIDSPVERCLVYDGANRHDLCLVEASIFAVGANERHIVVAQHPTKGFGYDGSITNYYIVDRIQRVVYSDRTNGVRGPLTRDQFLTLTTNLSLPPLSEFFDL